MIPACISFISIELCRLFLGSEYNFKHCISECFKSAIPLLEGLQNEAMHSNQCQAVAYRHTKLIMERTSYFELLSLMTRIKPGLHGAFCRIRLY